MSALDDIKLYFFHHHHYIDDPGRSRAVRTSVVDYPNAHYDPRSGHELYERHLRTMLRAEPARLRRARLNEHHSMAYSMTPTVELMAAPATCAATRAREDHGRRARRSTCSTRTASPRSTRCSTSCRAAGWSTRSRSAPGMEYWANEGTINPTTARARFRESLDVITQAWTRGRPVPLRRRLLQLPLSQRLAAAAAEAPPASASSWAPAARRPCSWRSTTSLGYSIVFVPIKNQLRAFARLRELADERGRTVDPGRSDHRRDGLRRRHGRGGGARGPAAHRELLQLVPPRHAEVPRAARVRRRRRSSCAASSDAALAKSTEATWDDMVNIGRIACGSPGHGRRHDRRTGAGRPASAASTSCSRTATCPSGRRSKNTTMFAEEVIPRIRARLGRGRRAPSADWQGWSSLMAAFSEERIDVNGIDTAVLSGRRAASRSSSSTAQAPRRLRPPAAARRAFRLIVPHHPGFGASADDPSIDSVHDYALHYLDLFDRLGLDELSLAGHSLGGWTRRHARDRPGAQRVRRLVLGAPFGLRVPEHPTVDFFSIPDEEVAGVSRRRPVDLRGHCRCRRHRSSSPTATASRPRSHGSRGSARTTSSCTVAASDRGADARSSGAMPIG